MGPLPFALPVLRLLCFHWDLRLTTHRPLRSLLERGPVSLASLSSRHPSPCAHRPLRPLPRRGLTLWESQALLPALLWAGSPLTMTRLPSPDYLSSVVLLSFRASAVQLRLCGLLYDWTRVESSQGRTSLALHLVLALSTLSELALAQLLPSSERSGRSSSHSNVGGLVPTESVREHSSILLAQLLRQPSLLVVDSRSSSPLGGLESRGCHLLLLRAVACRLRPHLVAFVLPSLSWPFLPAFG